MVPNWERSSSRLYIVTLLIPLICRVYHVKCWAGCITGWNQDCWRNNNHLRYADTTSLMAESEEELKSLLMRVKEERLKSWPKAQHSIRSWHLVPSLRGK
ncbi:unnamed protein product [Rangifer tarandus platyrhynchus]|uniref:Uncharacterized protein n=1 Tax=Rangifer tarandus platyrhynchus TaxID=3082113 RepID=A0AC59Y218_RANTA